MSTITSPSAAVHLIHPSSRAGGFLRDCIAAERVHSSRMPRTSLRVLQGFFQSAAALPGLPAFRDPVACATDYEIAASAISQLTPEQFIGLTPEDEITEALTKFTTVLATLLQMAADEKLSHARLADLRALQRFLQELERRGRREALAETYDCI